MKILGITVREKSEWPVEMFYNRPITNAIRCILHMDIGVSWKWRYDSDPFNWPSTTEDGRENQTGQTK